MSKLNNRDFILRPRQGTASAKAAFGSNFNEGELGYTTDERQMWIADSTQLLQPVGGPRLTLSNVTSNTVCSVTAGYAISDLFIMEVANHSVIAGIKIGTTSGGTEVHSSIAVAANSFSRTLISNMSTSGPFSSTVSQGLFIQAVSSWTSANATIVIPMVRAKI